MKFLILTTLSAIFISLSRATHLLQCPADENEDWTYRRHNGPENWRDQYPTCDGPEQSPININTSSVVMDENLARLTLVNYDLPVTNATIENNGHTIQVTPNDGIERTIQVNDETYFLRQLHFHWGLRFFGGGSEHTVDGRQYTMELHFVHTTEDGRIAVVGVFFRERLLSNPALRPVVKELNSIRFKDTTSQLCSNLTLNNLLPENPARFYRYNGSLTTPDCAEGVTWSVLPDPMPVGVLQMLWFRTMFSATREDATLGCTMARNYRPVQPVNDRHVLMSSA